MAEPSSSEPPNAVGAPGRPPAWLGYAALTLLILLVSGVFSLPGARVVPYNEGARLVQTDRVEKAVVTADDVVLIEKAEGKNAATEVRVTRLPGVADEPLMKALLDRNVPIEATRATTPFWLQAMFWVLPFLALNALFFYGIRRLGQGGPAGNPLALLKSRTRLYDRSKQDPVRFADVAGVDEAKDELVEIVDFLRQPERYRALGGRIPRGVLLIGPPGTGKTLLARAVAGEAGVPFFSLNASEFVEMFVGLGAARVRDLFEQAKKSAPSIVFIDEVDAVGRARGGTGTLTSHDEREQTLQQLLAELDGFDARTTVIVVAATNRPEVLDPALLRPGRFDRQVIVDRPDLQGRKAILDVHARRVPLALDVDLLQVARRTAGMAGADLANIVNEAALSGARRSASRVSQADFFDALDRVQLGLRRRGVIMTPAERRRVAYHEAGHALVALALPDADPVERVSIVARTIGALGMTVQVPRDDRRIFTEAELTTRITVILGGRAAEELSLREISTGAHDDLGKATAMLREMVTRLGMSRKLGLPTLTRTVGSPLLGTTTEERLCSEDTAREIDEEVRGRLAELHDAARRILDRKRSALESVAEALLARETLSGDEVAELAAAAPARELAPSAA
jgi:cell division protease FtsH